MNNQQINTNYISLFDAIKARNIRVYSKDNDISLKKLVSAEKAIKIAMKSIDNAIFLNYIAMQYNDEKAQDNFVAVKANVKILTFLASIGKKEKTALDSYSASIIANTLANDNNLTAKSALVTLSRSIEYSEFERQQKLKSRCNVAPSTASTQRSSSREALRILNLATITKRKKDDEIVLTEQGLNLFSELFA